MEHALFTTENGFSAFRSKTVNSTAQSLKASAGSIYGLNIVNGHSADIFVKLYDKTSVNPASDVPKYTLQVKANGQVLIRTADAPFVFSTGIMVRAVTGFTDTDTTAPGTLPIIEAELY